MRLNRVLPFLLFAAAACAHAAPKPGCQYFSQPEAAALIDQPVKAGMDFGMSICTYSSVNGSISVQAGLRPGQEGLNPVSELDDMVRGYTASHASVTPVSGLGDRAILVADASGNLTLFAAAKGNLVTVVIRGSKSLDSPARRDAMVKAAKLIISRL